MKKLMISAMLAVGLGGCALNSVLPQTPVVRIDVPFDRETAENMIQEDGTATVSGNAFLRQRGGGVVTCAGSVVRLIPATEYAKERMRYLYGSHEGVRISDLVINFKPNPRSYENAMRQTTCDARGDFEFNNVRKGEYFVQTIVQWRVGYRPQGGSLMTKVIVNDGQHRKVVMTVN